MTFLNQRVEDLAMQSTVLFTKLLIYKIKYFVVLIVIALIKFPDTSQNFSILFFNLKVLTESSMPQNIFYRSNRKI